MIGIKATFQNITENVQRTMDFFFHGKSFKGKVFNKKSTSKIVTQKNQAVKSSLLDQMEEYCDRRVDEGPMIVSCDGKYLREISDAVQDPHLVLSSVDLNYCSFSKSLGNILLQEKVTYSSKQLI